MNGASGVIAIDPLHLAAGSLFVVAVVILSAVLKLGVGRQYAWSAFRTYAQVLALGYILATIFDLDNGLMVLAVLTVMAGVASLTVAKRTPNAPGSIAPVAFIVMFVVSVSATFAVTGLLVGVEPWYLPRYVIPLCGMILGNSMSGMAIALERVFAEMDSRSDGIRTLVALGATPWEAAAPSVRAALKAGILPGMNTLATVGIVFIPGMMSGQVLAGSDPILAAPYQILMMVVIGAADVFGSTAAVMWTYRRRFDASGVFLEKAYSQHRD